MVFSGELIGVEYLLSQTGAVLQDPGRDPDAPDGMEVDESWMEEADEGFQDELALLSEEHQQFHQHPLSQNELALLSTDRPDLQLLQLAPGLSSAQEEQVNRYKSCIPL